jgi:lysophospholipase L1-like esterase
VEDARPETVAAIRQRGVDDLQLADAAIAEDVDINIGLLLKKLDELGIADNTYVIYTTDHGGYGRINAPLNNGKGSLLEGGIRVPLIIRGPGVKAGVCSHTRVAGIDLLPTIAELAHLKTSLPKSIEGGSLAPVLRSRGKAAVKRPREELIFHFPHYDYENDGPASVIFLGHLKAYKRYETGELRLYDLAKDLGVPGDATGQARFESARSAKWAYFLVGVDVSGAANRGTIVAIGDSITDGGSRRWPALLAARLSIQKKNYGVLNQGIAGNRILGHGEDDFGAIFGVNALARLERDVFGQPNVKYLILYEGINDIGQPGVFGNPNPPVTPAQVIAGMRQVIARAREHGLVVYGATLAPFEGTVLPGYYTPEKEATRQAVNQWIRTAKEFDGFFDFDKALQDPAHPTRLKPEYDSGDHLHPSDAGEKAMSEAIDLSRFK